MYQMIRNKLVSRHLNHHLLSTKQLFQSVAFTKVFDYGDF